MAPEDRRRRTGGETGGETYCDIFLTRAGLGTILGGVNMITTVVCMRAPGMTMFRMPIFTWNTLVTSLLVLIAFPILAGALLSLEADRLLGDRPAPADGAGFPPPAYPPPRSRRAAGPT